MASLGPKLGERFSRDESCYGGKENELNETQLDDNGDVSDDDDNKLCQ